MEPVISGLRSEARLPVGRRPGLLKSIVPVFVSFFVEGQVPAHIHEMMRIKTGQINDCTY